MGYVRNKEALLKRSAEFGENQKNDVWERSRAAGNLARMFAESYGHRAFAQVHTAQGCACATVIYDPYNNRLFKTGHTRVTENEYITYFEVNDTNLGHQHKKVYSPKLKQPSH